MKRSAPASDSSATSPIWISLGGLLAHHMDPEQPHVVTAEDQLQKAGLVADDLAARKVGVARAADDEVDALRAQRRLGLARHARFGNRVDPGRQDRRQVAS